MAAAEHIPTLDMLRAQRQEILRIAASRGAHNVHVFGSVARGDARDTSDIDLLVEMEPGRDVLDLSELILDLEECLHRQVDVIELGRSSPFADRVRSEAIPL